jgi:hypothetical protein
MYDETVTERLKRTLSYSVNSSSESVAWKFWWRIFHSRYYSLNQCVID